VPAHAAGSASSCWGRLVRTALASDGADGSPLTTNDRAQPTQPAHDAGPAYSKACEILASATSAVAFIKAIPPFANTLSSSSAGWPTALDRHHVSPCRGMKCHTNHCGHYLHHQTVNSPGSRVHGSLLTPPSLRRSGARPFCVARLRARLYSIRVAAVRYDRNRLSRLALLVDRRLPTRSLHDWADDTATFTRTMKGSIRLLPDSSPSNRDVRRHITPPPLRLPRPRVSLAADACCGHGARPPSLECPARLNGAPASNRRTLPCAFDQRSADPPHSASMSPPLHPASDPTSHAPGSARRAASRRARGKTDPAPPLAGRGACS